MQTFNATGEYSLWQNLTLVEDPVELRSKVKEAISEFQGCFRYYPTHVVAALEAKPHPVQLPHIHHGLGLCYMRLGDWNEMIHQNELALHANEAFVPAYEAIGDALLAQGRPIMASTYIKRGIRKGIRLVY